MLIDPFLGPLPRALLAGEHRDWLSPAQLLREPPQAVRGAPAPAGRAILGAALGAQNDAWGHVRGRELGQLLGSPETLVVVTGQQPGLFGGPLYSLSKAMAAVLWAEQMQRLGSTAVPVFWIASEDHDFAEMSQITSFPSAVRAMPPQDPAPLLPIGARVLPDWVVDRLDSLEAEVAAPDPRWRSQLREIWKPGVDWVDAFAHFMIALLGERCPLLLDARDPELKRQQAPLLAEALRLREELDAALQDRCAAIEKAGFRTQVRSQPGWAPLFVHRQGCRHRVGWEGDRYRLRGSDETGAVSALHEELLQDPEVGSAAALLRPTIQDALLGTSLFLVGPGELSYLAQASVCHRVLGVTAPAVALRPHCLLMDARTRRQWQKCLDADLSAETLLGADETLLAELAERAGPHPLDRLDIALVAAFEDVREELQQLDPQLESGLHKTRGNVDKAVRALRQRVDAARARQDQVLRGRADAVRAFCRPGGKLQERTVTVAALLLHYGDGLTTSMWAQLGIDPLRLHTVDLSAGVGG